MTLYGEGSSASSTYEELWRAGNSFLRVRELRFFLSRASHFTIYNGQWNIYSSDDPGLKENIRRNEKLTEDDPKTQVPFSDALWKDKHSKVLSKKDYSVTKFNLGRGNHIRYCHLSSTLENNGFDFCFLKYMTSVLASE